MPIITHQVDDQAGSQPTEVERSAIRLTARRILPLLILCYFVAYLDRVNLSFAALQMSGALQLTSAEYGFGAGLFFLSYCLCEIPSNLLLHRVGATRWIARIMLALGVCAAGMAFVGGKNSFYAMRLLLGIAEAGFYPGILYFLTGWFPAAYSARILGYFIAAIPISGIVGICRTTPHGHGGCPRRRRPGSSTGWARSVRPWNANACSRCFKA